MALHGSAKCPHVMMTVFVLGNSKQITCDLDVNVDENDGIYTCICSNEHLHYLSDSWVDSNVTPEEE